MRFGARALEPRRLRRRRQDAPLDPEGEVLRRAAGQGLRRPHRQLGAALPAAPRPARRRRRRAARPARRSSSTMPKSVATWYGPGFFGERTACGKTLRRKTIGVAHRTLPCGTKVTLKYRGRYVQGPGDRPRPLRQRRSLGPDPERRLESFTSPPRTRSAPPRSSSYAPVTRTAAPRPRRLARRRRAGPTGRTGPAAGRRRWPSGSGTRSAPRGRPPRGAARRSSRPRAPPRAGGGPGARRPRTAP